MRVWRSWSSGSARLCALGWPCSFCCCSYYWGYCHYCDYFAGKCTAWDIGIERLSSAQGPLRTIQLFGAWPHQVQWCAAGLLQPVPCETTLQQPQIGPPGIEKGAFVVTPDSIWYAQGLLLFSALAQTDTGSKSFDCALVSTLETYDDPENGNYWYYCNCCHYCLCICFIEIIVISVIMEVIEKFQIIDLIAFI